MRFVMHGGRSTILVRLAAAALLLLSASPAAHADTYRLPLLPSAADPLRQGMVRIVNHSAAAGDVAVTAIDDSGRRFGPLTLRVNARQAIHFTSADLERGNEDLGIPIGIGGGQGDWRLVLDSDLDIEPLAYVQTEAGFLESLHDVVPRPSFYHRVTLLSPESSGSSRSELRLINPGPDDAQVLIFGVGNDGAPATGHVAATLPAGTARTINAAELENSAVGLDGQFGDGKNDWQLLVFANAEIEAMTLLDSVSGPLANLSTAVGNATSMLAAGPPHQPVHGGRQRLGNPVVSCRRRNVAHRESVRGRQHPDPRGGR